VDNPEHDSAEARASSASDDVDRIESRLARAEHRYHAAVNMPPSEERKQAVDRALTQVHRMRSQLGRASSDLHSASTRLARTPRQLQEDVYRDHTYAIHKITRTARLRVSMKMVDTLMGRALMEETFDGTAAASDETVKADSAHNVREDPLNLPDDFILKDRALDDAMRKCRRFVQEAIAKYGRRYQWLAENALATGENGAAIENCVNFLAANAFSAAHVQPIRDVLEEIFPHESDLLDLKGVFRANARLLSRKRRFVRGD